MLDLLIYLVDLEITECLCEGQGPGQLVGAPQPSEVRGGETKAEPYLVVSSAGICRLWPRNESDLPPVFVRLIALRKASTFFK